MRFPCLYAIFSAQHFMSAKLKETLNTFCKKLILTNTTEITEPFQNETTVRILNLMIDHTSVLPLRTLNTFANHLAAHFEKTTLVAMTAWIRSNDFKLALATGISSAFDRALSSTISCEDIHSTDMLAFPFTGGEMIPIFEQLDTSVSCTILKKEVDLKKIISYLVDQFQEIRNSPVIMSIYEHAFNSNLEQCCLPKVEDFEAWFEERFVQRVQKKLEGVSRSQKEMKNFKFEALMISKDDINIALFLSTFKELTKQEISDISHCIDIQLYKEKLFYPFEIAQIVSDTLFAGGKHPMPIHLIEHRLIEQFKLIPFFRIGDSNWGDEISKMRNPIYLTPNMTSDEPGAICIMYKSGRHELKELTQGKSDATFELYF